MRKLLILLTALAALMAVGQSRRTITPVEPELQTKAPASAQKEQQLRPTEMPNVVVSEDAKGRTIYVDTITGLEVIDSLAMKPPKMLYPTIYRLSVGLNIWDAAMRAMGQDYGLGGVWAMLNMHNRYFGYLECGLGQADTRPEGMNYRYRSGVAPYFKLGGSYNMFYNSNPDYQLHCGVRYGLTHFGFSVDDVTLTDGYWDETAHFSIPQQTVTAGYLEIAVGVRVKIWGPLSAGWDAMYHTLLHESRAPLGRPMYIPGYGKRGNSFAAALSLSWTFGLNKPAPPEVDNSTDD